MKLKEAKVQDFCSPCGRMKVKLFILSSSTGFAEVFCKKCLKSMEKSVKEYILEKQGLEK